MPSESIELFKNESMNGPIQSEPRGNEFLRALAFVFAILIFLHMAAIPIYWGFGSLMIFGVPSELKILGFILVFTAFLSLAGFCLATQFYLESKRKK